MTLWLLSMMFDNVMLCMIL